MLFDWKGAEGEHFGEHAFEGFHLTDVDKFILPDEQWRYFWGHADETGFDVLKRDIGENKGWEFNKDYHFKLTYTSSRIIISIDGEEIFDVSGCFKAGGFGFYAFSQQNLLFKNFDYRLDVEFKTDQSGYGWDGQYKGTDCPVGTYVYTLTYSGMGEDIKSFTETQSGTVALLR
ncbi:MAG: hypothetical protein U5Q03_01640 [Bacteroidota bacterium]|nr:hypothetical protein [Bacteroidota bacterium]